MTSLRSRYAFAVLLLGGGATAIVACGGGDGETGETVETPDAATDARTPSTDAASTDAAKPDAAKPDAAEPEQDAGEDAAPAKTYAVTGSITGLDGTVVLKNNGADPLTRTTNGPFAFAASLASGSDYDVTIDTQPAGQNCLVTNGKGKVGSADISNVAVACEYRQTITVTSADAAALAGFQVPVTLTAANFKYASAKAGGADLRFSIDGVDRTVPYWIESWNAGGESRVWIKVPAIPANGTTTVYAHYGNAALAPASSGDATFELFDDFEDGAYATKWDVFGTPSVIEETGGELHLVGNSNWEYVASKKSFTTAVVVHTDYRTQGPSVGFVLADAATRLRYSFREQSGMIGTTEDPDVSGGNSYLDSSYPGLAFSGGMGAPAAWSIEVAAGVTANAVKVSSWCNLTTATCNVVAKDLPANGIAAFVPGFTTYSPAYGSVWLQLFHVRKYSAAVVTAAVD